MLLCAIIAFRKRAQEEKGFKIKIEAAAFRIIASWIQLYPTSAIP
jgi:hypothetical protein